MIIETQTLLRWLLALDGHSMLICTSNKYEYWAIAWSSPSFHAQMNIEWLPNVHMHLKQIWKSSNDPMFIATSWTCEHQVSAQYSYIPTLGVNDNQVGIDIHFHLRRMWTSIGHSIINFTWVEGWNWVATWYSTLLEIDWLPNIYPHLKHNWTAGGPPMFTLDTERPPKYSHLGDGTSSIKQLPDIHLRLRCGSRSNGHSILWFVWDVGRHLSHDIYDK
jgi:hypothetical protein